MGFPRLFDFLKRLQQNNHKEWMDANRKEYNQVRNFFIEWLDTINNELVKIDDDYFDTPGKKAINRINNNLMFHPNRPVYKDHFAGGLDQVNKQGDFYIRDAIDYNGEELLAIVNKKSFKSTFGGMLNTESLKNSPKGYSNDHPYIDLLKMKSFAAGWTFTQQEVLHKNFDKKVIGIYKELLPFRRYLNEAVTV